MSDTREGECEAVVPRRRWLPWAVPAAALAVLLGFALHAEIKYRRRAAAIRVLQEIGDVTFGQAPPPGWISKLIGSKAKPDRPMSCVQLQEDSATDAALAHIGRIPELEVLGLDYTRVTDAGLAHIAGLSKLQDLHLDNTRVTDAGLAQIASLTSLGYLHLAGTDVTDSGLAHIAGLTNLKDLDLGDTEVTDAGLAHIRGLSKLRQLYLRNTRVTDAGVAELKKHLPDTQIVRQ